MSMEPPAPPPPPPPPPSPPPPRRPRRRRRPAGRPLVIGDAVGYGWDVYWKNVGTLVVIALVVVGIEVVFGVVANEVENIALQIIVQFVGTLVGMLVSLGWLRVSLEITARREARGRRPVPCPGLLAVPVGVDPLRASASTSGCSC